MRYHKHQRQRAVTLIELTVSLSIASVLMGGVASAMVLASRAIPDPQSPVSATINGYHTLEQVAGELLCAQSVTERSATSIEFTVADRDDPPDGTPETIRYAWSGSPGDPLTRQYNGSTAVELAGEVYEFQLAYEIETAIEQPPPTATESAEFIVSAYEIPVIQKEGPIADQMWTGQHIPIAFPPTVIEWRVTHVMFMARSDGALDGVTAVQLRPAVGGNVPGSTVLDETLLNETALAPVMTLQEVFFDNAGGLSPTQDVCLVLAWSAGTPILAFIRYDASGSGLLGTTDAGGNWTYDGSSSMWYRLYGTATTVTDPGPVTVYRLRTVGLTMRISADPSVRVSTSTQILNAPDVGSL